MPKVTKITTQKNNIERYNVYIDQGKGEEFGFGVDEYVLAKFQLRKGQELSSTELTTILHEDTIKKSYNMSLAFLAHRMRSTKEVYTYLIKKELEPEVANAVIAMLNERKYLNDLEFAKAYVNTQVNTTIKGPNLIRQELIEKGISEADISTSLQSFDNEQQLEAAGKYAAKLDQKYKKLAPIMKKQKIQLALNQKGYAHPLINRLFETFELTDDEDQQLEAIRYQGMKAHRRYQKYEGWEYENKMKQSLYRKGFSMDQIQAFLEALKEEE